MTESLPPSLGTRALEHARFLADKIGPRPAGSPDETYARDYIASQISQWGYSLKEEAFQFSPIPNFSPLYPFGVLLFLIIAWNIQNLTIFAALLPIVIAGLPQLSRWAVRNRRRIGSSTNLHAAPTNLPAGLPTLLFVAHIDSARASPLYGRFWNWLDSNRFPLLQRLSIWIAALGILEALQFSPPAIFFPLTGIAASIAAAGFLTIEIAEQFFHNHQYSPGANDNASGVGVLLALAEHLQNQPTELVRVEFLFTGAEETGLHGAEAYARQLAASDAADNTMVISLDMVGAGKTLCYISREGTISPLHTDHKLNKYLKKVHPPIRDLWYTLRSGDFAPFLRRGIRATALQTTGSPRAHLSYHTIHDTSTHLESSALDLTAYTVWKMIQIMDKPYL